MLSMVNRTSMSRGADAHQSMPHAAMPQMPQMPMPPAFDVTAMLEASRPSLAAAAELNGRLCETMTAFNSECVSFLNRRLREDLAMPRQFAACRTLEDVYGVYSGFFQRATEQYQAEMEQLAKISQSAAHDTIHHAQEQATKARREMR
jgi:hypothetical protein